MKMLDNRERLGVSSPKPGCSGHTGTWRVFRPIVDKEICNNCGMCAMYCPDGVIDTEYIIDLDYCKGCGICANECPKKAIKMVEELTFR